MTDMESLLLGNPFFKAVVVPVFLALAAALLEASAALVRGKVRGSHKFRVWINQAQPDKSMSVVPLQGQSLHALRAMDGVVDIDDMVSFDLAAFGTVGIDLIIGTFAVDITTLIDGQGNSVKLGYLVFAHLMMLVGIVMFLMLANLAGPHELKSKRVRAGVAVGLGLIAMMTSFMAK